MEYWPRSCCVYCGRRIRSRRQARPTRHPLACYRHVRLVAFDPHYGATPTQRTA